MICDYCSQPKNTEEIYGDLQICKDCKANEEEVAAIAESIEG